MVSELRALSTLAESVTRKWALALVVVVLTSFAMPAPSQAFVAHGCKFQGSNPTLHVKNTGVQSYLWTATMAGADRWNSHTVAGNFAPWSSGESAEIFVDEASFVDVRIWAQTSWVANCPNGIYYSNETYFTWSSESTLSLTSTQRRMVATHELGHSYGLDHAPDLGCSGTRAVMIQGARKWSCNWNNEPWPDDLAGVNYIY